jgi:RNA polymerase sigma factor (sigma-70 family)
VEASAVRVPAGIGRIALPAALLRLRTDDQLLALFRSGHDDAFGVLHDRYRPRLLAYTRQMLGGSRSDAEDALQDVFLRAYHALRVDDRPVAVKAWLYRVAHNRCIDQLRRPVPDPSDVLELSRTPVVDPSAETERREDLRRLVADVQRLPDQQRSALLMRELEGLAYADLAAALDVTVPAVKSLLVRARIGLVEAAEARDTACCDIRHDLALSSGKGVRAGAKARRHMRECDDCRRYRTELRAIQAGVRSLVPDGSGPLGLLAKLLGLGGGGVAVSGGAAAAGGAKVAAIVCCAAMTVGGAAGLEQRTVSAPDADRQAAPATAPGVPALDRTPDAMHPGRAPGMAAAAAPERGRERAASATLRSEEPISPHGIETIGPTGGLAAPEETADVAAPVAPAVAPDVTADDDTAVDPATPHASDDEEAAEPADPSAAGSSGGVIAGSSPSLQ